MLKEAVFTMKLESDLRDEFMAAAEETHRPAMMKSDTEKKKALVCEDEAGLVNRGRGVGKLRLRFLARWSVHHHMRCLDCTGSLYVVYTVLLGVGAPASSADPWRYLCVWDDG